MRGGGFPFGLHVVLLLPDGVEEQCVAADVDVGLSDLPASIADHPALDVEGAPAVQLAEDAPTNADIVAELASQRPNAMTVLGDDELAGHDSEHTRLHIRR